MIVGAVGIIGPKPTLIRIITAACYLLFFGLMIIYIRKDMVKAQLRMYNHHLLMKGRKFIIQQGDLSKTFDLRDIHSIRVKSKNKAVKSIIVYPEKGLGFAMKGYAERIDS